MQNLTFTQREINAELLSAELQAALSSMTSGVSSGPYGVIVHLNDNATAEQIAQARAIVENHDPAVLTPRQEAEQQRQQKLAEMRSSISADLDPADYDGENALIQALAERIAWLEQEVIALGGGGDVRQ